MIKDLCWSGRRGSNPQPTAWEAATLPLSYSRSISTASGYHPGELRATTPRLFDWFDDSDGFGRAAVGQLHDRDCGEYEYDADDLERADKFAQGNCGNDDGEYGLQAADHDGACGFEILQAGEVAGKRSHHRDQREQDQENPLAG